MWALKSGLGMVEYTFESASAQNRRLFWPKMA